MQIRHKIDFGKWRCHVIFLLFQSIKPSSKYQSAFDKFAEEVIHNFIAEKTPRTLTWMLENFVHLLKTRVWIQAFKD